MEYIRAFDVCLIPELLGAFNIATCPQKMWNYLASSRPVVSTAVPEQLLYEPIVMVGKSPDEFVAHIVTALRTSEDETLARQRLELVRAHTWEVLSHRLYIELVRCGIVHVPKQGLFPEIKDF